jgi:hypothetical protein
MDALTAWRGEHIQKGSAGHTSVPGIRVGAVMAMSFPHKPQHDQAVKQQRHGSRPLHRLTRPALRFLKAQVLLAIVDGNSKLHRHEYQLSTSSAFALWQVE